MIELRDLNPRVGSVVKVVLPEYVLKHSDAVAVAGLVGTVMVESAGTKGLFAVEFPEYWDGHTCDGNCTDPHGWWVNECNLEVVQ